VRRVSFQLAMLFAWPLLQTGADLARLHKRAPAGLRPPILLLWFPVRLLGLAAYQVCVWIAP